MKKGDLFKAKEPIPGVSLEEQKNYMIEFTGQKRRPKAGEWYLSGAIPAGYLALNNLSGSFPIGEPVRVERLPSPYRKVRTLREEKGYGVVHRTNINGLSIELSHQGINPAPWDENNPHYFYNLRVSSEDTTAKFDYWGSTYDLEHHNVWQDARGAARVVFEDALSYIQARDIEDFADELGYEHGPELSKAWEGCKAAAVKLEALGLTEQMLCDIVNVINGDVE